MDAVMAGWNIDQESFVPTDAASCGSGVVGVKGRTGMLETPRRRDMTRLALPPSRGGRTQTVPGPDLKPIERTVFVVLSRPLIWHLVDEFVGSPGSPSPMRNALWRRGFEVRQRPSELNEQIVQVWARWTHEIPTTVAPWEL